MKLVRGAWKLLVGIKDCAGAGLHAAVLRAAVRRARRRGRPAQRSGTARWCSISTGRSSSSRARPIRSRGWAAAGALREFRLRDVVRALDTRADRRAGEGRGARSRRFARRLSRGARRVAEAVGARARQRQAGARLCHRLYRRQLSVAANASEIWVNPMGGTLFTGPGGIAALLQGADRQAGRQRARLPRRPVQVGGRALYRDRPVARGARGERRRCTARCSTSGRRTSRRARPKAQIAASCTDPTTLVVAAGGDIAQANLAAGIVDKLGDRADFRQARRRSSPARDSDKPAGSSDAITLTIWIAANPLPDRRRRDRRDHGRGRDRRRQGRARHRGRRHDRQADARRAGQEEAQGAGRARRFAGRIGAGVGADPPGDPGGQGAGAAGGRVDGRARRIGRLLGVDARAT